MGPLAILSLVNAAIPAVTNLVLLIKNDTGSVTMIVSSAETATAADIANMQAWLAAHHAAQTPPATPAS
jgi:hypothetical protein